MTAVPDAPQAFFTEFLPERAKELSDALRGKTSPGSMTFRVIGDGEWTLRIADGALAVSNGMADDVIVQVTLPSADFKRVFVDGARSLAERKASVDKQVFAFKVLDAPADRIRMVKMIPGSLGFFVKEPDTTRVLVVSPGSRAFDLEKPECRLDCSIDDWEDMQSGKVQPMQLVMGGKMKMSGNPQIAMALAGVFA